MSKNYPISPPCRKKTYRNAQKNRGLVRYELQVNASSKAKFEKLILTDYFVRFLYAMLGGGPAWLFVIFLKKRENTDVYDVGTNFNPFKLTLKD